MIYRTLGQSGLKVSALTLGTMMFGEQTNTEDSLRIIDKAWDQGINFIDTADVWCTASGYRACNRLRWCLPPSAC